LISIGAYELFLFIGGRIPLFNPWLLSFLYILNSLILYAGGIDPLNILFSKYPSFIVPSGNVILP